MRCTFCTRQSKHELLGRDGEVEIYLCEECSKSFRCGFEHGRVYESIDRRRRGHR